MLVEGIAILIVAYALFVHPPCLKPWWGLRRPPHKRDAKWFT